jgi:hypothetical protein
LPDINSITSLLGALTPIIAIVATVWISTNVSRSQKRFDRETELLADLREACATYVQMTIHLAWQARKLRTQQELEEFQGAEAYGKVRAAYQFIMMFSTDSVIRASVTRMSELDDQRSAIVRKAINEGTAPMTEQSPHWQDYQRAADEFSRFQEEFYKTIRERMQHHTGDRRGSTS